MIIMLKLNEKIYCKYKNVFTIDIFKNDIKCFKFDIFFKK